MPGQGLGGGNDFFLTFGSNAESFATELEGGVTRAKSAINELGTELQKYERLRQAKSSGGPIANPFKAMEAAADSISQKFERVFDRLGDRVSELNTEIRQALAGIQNIPIGDGPGKRPPNTPANTHPGRVTIANVDAVTASLVKIKGLSVGNTNRALDTFGKRMETLVSVTDRARGGIIGVNSALAQLNADIAKMKFQAPEFEVQGPIRITLDGAVAGGTFINDGSVGSGTATTSTTSTSDDRQNEAADRAAAERERRTMSQRRRDDVKKQRERQEAELEALKYTGTNRGYGPTDRKYKVGSERRAAQLETQIAALTLAEEQADRFVNDNDLASKAAYDLAKARRGFRETSRKFAAGTTQQISDAELINQARRSGSTEPRNISSNATITAISPSSSGATNLDVVGGFVQRDSRRGNYDTDPAIRRQQIREDIVDSDYRARRAEDTAARPFDEEKAQNAKDLARATKNKRLLEAMNKRALMSNKGENAQRDIIDKLLAQSEKDDPENYQAVKDNRLAQAMRDRSLITSADPGAKRLDALLADAKERDEKRYKRVAKRGFVDPQLRIDELTIKRDELKRREVQLRDQIAAREERIVRKLVAELDAMDGPDSTGGGKAGRVKLQSTRPNVESLPSGPRTPDQIAAALAQGYDVSGDGLNLPGTREAMAEARQREQERFTNLYNETRDNVRNLLQNDPDISEADLGRNPIARAALADEDQYNFEKLNAKQGDFTPDEARMLNAIERRNQERAEGRARAESNSALDSAMRDTFGGYELDTKRYVQNGPLAEVPDQLRQIKEYGPEPQFDARGYQVVDPQWARLIKQTTSLEADLQSPGAQMRKRMKAGLRRKQNDLEALLRDRDRVMEATFLDIPVLGTDIPLFNKDGSAKIGRDGKQQYKQVAQTDENGKAITSRRIEGEELQRFQAAREDAISRLRTELSDGSDLKDIFSKRRQAKKDGNTDEVTRLNAALQRMQDEAMTGLVADFKRRADAVFSKARALDVKVKMVPLGKADGLEYSDRDRAIAERDVGRSTESRERGAKISLLGAAIPQLGNLEATTATAQRDIERFRARLVESRRGLASNEAKLAAAVSEAHSNRQKNGTDPRRNARVEVLRRKVLEAQGFVRAQQNGLDLALSQLEKTLNPANITQGSSAFERLRSIGAAASAIGLEPTGQQAITLDDNEQVRTKRRRLAKLESQHRIQSLRDIGDITDEQALAQLVADSKAGGFGPSRVELDREVKNRFGDNLTEEDRATKRNYLQDQGFGLELLRENVTSRLERGLEGYDPKTGQSTIPVDGVPTKFAVPQTQRLQYAADQVDLDDLKSGGRTALERVMNSMQEEAQRLRAELDNPVIPTYNVTAADFTAALQRLQREADEQLRSVLDAFAPKIVPDVAVPPSKSLSGRALEQERELLEQRRRQDAGRLALIRRQLAGADKGDATLKSEADAIEKNFTKVENRIKEINKQLVEVAKKEAAGTAGPLVDDADLIQHEGKSFRRREDGRFERLRKDGKFSVLFPKETDLAEKLAQLEANRPIPTATGSELAEQAYLDSLRAKRLAGGPEAEARFQGGLARGQADRDAGLVDTGSAVGTAAKQPTRVAKTDEQRIAAGIKAREATLLKVLTEYSDLRLQLVALATSGVTSGKEFNKLQNAINLRVANRARLEEAIERLQQGDLSVLRARKSKREAAGGAAEAPQNSTTRSKKTDADEAATYVASREKSIARAQGKVAAATQKLAELAAAGVTNGEEVKSLNNSLKAGKAEQARLQAAINKVLKGDLSDLPSNRSVAGDGGKGGGRGKGKGGGGDDTGGSAGVKRSDTVLRVHLVSVDTSAARQMASAFTGKGFAATPGISKTAADQVLDQIGSVTTRRRATESAIRVSRGERVLSAADPTFYPQARAAKFQAPDAKGAGGKAADYDVLVGLVNKLRALGVGAVDARTSVAAVSNVPVKELAAQEKLTRAKAAIDAKGVRPLADLTKAYGMLGQAIDKATAEQIAFIQSQLRAGSIKGPEAALRTYQAYDAATGPNGQKLSDEAKLGGTDLAMRQAGITMSRGDLQKVEGAALASKETGTAIGSDMSGAAVAEATKGGKLIDRIFRTAGAVAIRDVAGMAVFGITNQIGQLVQAGLETESTFIRVQAALDATEKSGDGMRASLARISSETGAPLMEVYKSAAQLVGVFDNVGDVTTVTRLVYELQAVSAGALSAEESFRALTAITSAYGLRGPKALRQVADMATNLQLSIGVNVEDTLEGAARLSPIAKQYGMSLPEISTLTGVVGKATGQTGTAASEQVGRILETLSSPKVRKLLTTFTGKDGQPIATDEQFEGGKYGDVVNQLMEAAASGSLSLQQKSSLASALGGQRNFASASAILNQASTYIRGLDEAQKENNITASLSKDINAQLQRELVRLGENFNNLGAALIRGGVLGGLEQFVELLNAVLGPLVSASAALGDAVGGLDKLTSGLGLGNSLFSDLAKWAVALGTVAVAVRALKAVFKGGLAGEMLTQGVGLDLGGGAGGGGVGGVLGAGFDNSTAANRGRVDSARRAARRSARGVGGFVAAPVTTTGRGVGSLLGGILSGTGGLFTAGAKGLDLGNDDYRNQSARSIARNDRLQQSLARVGKTMDSAGTKVNDGANKLGTGLGGLSQALRVANVAAIAGSIGFMVYNQGAQEFNDSKNNLKSIRKARATVDEPVTDEVVLDAAQEEVLKAADPGFARFQMTLFKGIAKNIYGNLRYGIDSYDNVAYTEQVDPSQESIDILKDPFIEYQKLVRTPATTPEAQRERVVALQASLEDIDKAEKAALEVAGDDPGQQASIMVKAQEMRDAIAATATNAEAALQGLVDGSILAQSELEAIGRLQGLSQLDSSSLSRNAPIIENLIERSSTGADAGLNAALAESLNPNLAPMTRDEARLTAAQIEVKRLQANLAGLGPVADSEEYKRTADQLAAALMEEEALYRSVAGNASARAQSVVAALQVGGVTTEEAVFALMQSVAAGQTELDATPVGQRNTQYYFDLQTRNLNERKQLGEVGNQGRMNDSVLRAAGSRSETLKAQESLGQARLKLQTLDDTIGRYEPGTNKLRTDAAQAIAEIKAGELALADSLNSRSNALAQVALAGLTDPVDIASGQLSETRRQIAQGGLSPTALAGLQAQEAQQQNAAFDAREAQRAAEAAARIASITDPRARAAAELTENLRQQSSNRGRNATQAAQLQAAEASARQAEFDAIQGEIAARKAADIQGIQDPVLRAGAELNETLRQSAANKGRNATQAETLRGQETQNRIALAAAISAEKDAQDALAIAKIEARGEGARPVAEYKLGAAIRKVREARATGNKTQLYQAQADEVAARAAVRDATVTDAEESISFNMEMGKITGADAIAQLQILLKNKELSQAQKRDLMRKIKGYQNASEGQFNLGDIKMPTVYEVRRALAGGASARTAAGAESRWSAANDMRTYQININGGDLGKVRQVLTDALGSNATNRVTVAPKKGA